MYLFKYNEDQGVGLKWKLLLLLQAFSEIEDA